MPKRQVIAIGGGGFSDRSEPGLDTYLLEQARSEHPTIAFVGTATGDSDRYTTLFYARFNRLPCRPVHLSLFGRTPDLAEFFADVDVIYVGGGNTRSMLAVWREWGLPQVLRAAWQAGTVLAGISAGAICWFEQGVTDSGAASLSAMDCTGILPGSCCPHFAAEAERKPAYAALLEAGEISPGVAIDDGAAVHFVDDAPWRVVTGREGASGYAARLVDGKADLRELAVETVRVDPLTTSG